MDEVYFEVVQPDRSRLYGTGSAGRSQVSRGSTSTTGASAMSQQMYETRISELVEERLTAERAEREALHQRMIMMEQYMRQMGQLPPSPTHHDDD